jgi:hypothetical protein
VASVTVRWLAIWESVRIPTSGRAMFEPPTPAIVTTPRARVPRARTTYRHDLERYLLLDLGAHRLNDVRSGDLGR